MSVIRVGSTKKFSDGWDGIFGGVKSAAPKKKAVKATKRKSVDKPKATPKKKAVAKQKATTKKKTAKPQAAVRKKKSAAKKAAKPKPTPKKKTSARTKKKAGPELWQKVLF